jgi:glycosyltransferase involved in cell wall biosynthesis
MIKTKLPTGLIYGHTRTGTFTAKSDIYHEEGLFEDVIIYSYDNPENFMDDFNRHQPDIILTIGETTKQIEEIIDKNLPSNETLIRSRRFVYPKPPDSETMIANDIVCKSVFTTCALPFDVHGNKENPFFSCFTGLYNTGRERIYRAYEGLKNQTYPNWEWVAVDDSPIDNNDTWEILQEIANNDHRVKIYRISPNSGGNVGEVKHRAAMLCNGEWLFELDHDDKPMPTLFEDCVKAIKQYPDAGFIYTDCCELFEDGEWRPYGVIAPNREWYHDPMNGFVWGYAGHEYITIDGKEYLAHLCAEMNPKTIRFNIGMPNHARIWRKDVYSKVGGHSRNMPVADDLELIIKTFLETRMLHIRKMLYLQYNNRSSTVSSNGIDINRRARLIKDHYDLQIHERIKQLGMFDHEWIEERGHSNRLQGHSHNLMWGEDEQILNYIYEDTENNPLSMLPMLNTDTINVPKQEFVDIFKTTIS